MDIVLTKETEGVMGFLRQCFSLFTKEETLRVQRETET